MSLVLSSLYGEGDGAIKTIAIIQSRLGSTRLPNKVLLQIPPESGVSMLEMVVRKTMLATKLDDVVVVTPDRLIAVLCNRWNVKAFMPFWKGRDVLREFYEAAKTMAMRPGDVVVRVTGDCPMIQASEIDRLVQCFEDSHADVVYNTDESTGQLEGEGSDVEIFSYYALTEANNYATGDDREHVCTWIRRNMKSLFARGAPLGLRSVNDMEDYRHVCELVSRLTHV